MEKFQHEIALDDYGTSYLNMPGGIKRRIVAWESKKRKIFDNLEPDQQPNQQELIQLRATSAVIAHEIQDFMEKDLADEEIPNPNNMLNDQDKARAKAVGLDENTATVEQIAAKEKEIADKAEAERLEAERIAKEEKEKKEKQTPPANADDDDEDIIDSLT